jgi:hypothetical protein
MKGNRLAREIGRAVTALVVSLAFAGNAGAQPDPSQTQVLMREWADCIRAVGRKDDGRTDMFNLSAVAFLECQAQFDALNAEITKNSLPLAKMFFLENQWRESRELARRILIEDRKTKR